MATELLHNLPNKVFNLTWGDVDTQPFARAADLKFLVKQIRGNRKVVGGTHRRLELLVPNALLT